MRFCAMQWYQSRTHMLKPLQGAGRPRSPVGPKVIVCLLASVAAVLPAPRTRLENYAIILPEEPVAARIRARVELNSVPARRHRDSIVAAQRRLQAALTRRQITILGS